VDEEAEDPGNRYRLRVIASDVTHRRMLVLPDDADHLGVDPDELEIAYAVRMSMSIPIFFEPVIHKNPGSGEEHLIVDGGMRGADRPPAGGRGARRQAGLADRLYLENATFARMIPIPTLGVGTTEFEIYRDRVKALYDSGHAAASEFLDQWDFAAYIEEFRRGKSTPRRT
jgi:NTE family protein